MEEQWVFSGQLLAAQLWVHAAGQRHCPGLLPRQKILVAKGLVKPCIPKARAGTALSRHSVTVRRDQKSVHYQSCKAFDLISSGMLLL